ncbi:MAG: type II toxin-antitoxin system ParD family antitoxin [Anaerolineae bacterium]|nr:type II toxin-antitoxin system ParD family antitoxin [Phycisphaerae bacterium]
MLDEVNRMEFKPTEDSEQFIESKIHSGQYKSADGVVNAALSLLRDQEELSGSDLDELRSEINKGLEQSRAGQSMPLDMGSIRAEIRRRRDQRKTA